MKATELIQEIIDYYSADVSRRAQTESGGCYYEIGQKSCAVGRCLKEEFRSKLLGSWDELFDLDKKPISKELKETFFLEKYQGFPEQLWRDLQALHDAGIYWQKDGLSDLGKEYAARLMEKFAKTTN